MESTHDIVYGNNPVSAKARQFFASLDILTGTNNDDGALYLRNVWTVVLHETFQNIHLNRSTFDRVVAPLVVQSVLKPKCKKLAEQLISAVIYQYTDWSDPNNDTKVRDLLVDLSSDIAFFVPAVDTVRGHSSFGQGRTYLYDFALKLDKHTLPTPSYITGSNHADEIGFVFGYPVSNAYITNVTFTDNQKAVSTAMLAMWTNFAKTSDPNSPTPINTYTGSAWPVFTLAKRDYLQFTAIPNTNKVKQRFQAKRMAFWLEYIPSILNLSCD